MPLAALRSRNPKVSAKSLAATAPRETAMNLDDKICYCFHVSRRKLMNYARIHQPKVASQLSECGGAGTGCGCCIPFLEQIFRQQAKKETVELDLITPEEYERQRAEYIRAGKGTPPEDQRSEVRDQKSER